MNTRQRDSSRDFPRLGLSYGINILLVAGFLGLIEYFIGWRQLLAPWIELSLLTVIVSLALVLVSYLLRAYRVYDYFRADMVSRFALCLRLSLQHNLFNNLLPMRAGELSFPLLMSRYFAIPAGRSLSVLFWFRLLDLHVLLLFCIPLLLIDTIPGSVLTLVCVVWLCVPYLLFRFYRALGPRFSSASGRLGRLIQQVLGSLPGTLSELIKSMLWTVLNWGIKLAAFTWILGLFSQAEFRANWIGATLGDITSVLPIHSVAGIGTYEAGVVAGLTPFGIPAVTAVQAAVNLHLFVLGCTLVSGLITLALPRGSTQSTPASGK